MASSDNVRNYVNAAEIVNYWLKNVNPRYFNMENVNTYRAGTLGLITDLMATTVEDTAHAVMIARREFYPNTAQYLKSLYTHAASRFMDAPMAKPATANILLMIQQSDILKYGTTEGDLHTFVLDDTFIAYVDDIPFMLDYPVKILSVKKENGKYAHTTHYDFYIDNSLSTDPERYLPNKVINYKGVEYIIISATMRQINKTYISKLVSSNTIVNTVTMDFNYDGDLANFEVFYTENDNTPRVQLEKRMSDSGISKNPFCWYTLVDESTIRITFPANVYFTPKLNSTISMEIATSLGEGGNFDTYESDIVSQNASTRYPYNAQVPVFGTVDGASSGGENVIGTEDFRMEVMRAYCTNHTYISTNDLQMYFDQLMINTDDKFKFTPKRDDAFIRLYGAFILMKDEASNVIPTNTLDIVLDPLQEAKDFDIYSDAVHRYIIKPGALFVYNHDDLDDGYSLVRLKNIHLSDDLADYDDDGGHWYCKKCGYVYTDSENTPFTEILNDNTNAYVCPECGAAKTDFLQDRFLFTNPYLISISTDNFIAGYFLNSINAHHDLSYTAVNDNSIVQFIARHFNIKRNAIAGENFYRISVAISPSVEIDQSTIFESRDEVIAAKHNGFVKAIEHDGKAVYATIKYTDDPTLVDPIPEEESEEKIQISSYIEKTDEYFYICPSCGYRMTKEEWEAAKANDFMEEDGVTPMNCPGCTGGDAGDTIGLVQDMEWTYVDYDYFPGFDFKFEVGDSISKNDVLATAKPKDLGRVRIIMDLDNVMSSQAKRYIPLTLEEAHTDTTEYYIFAAYIATDDMIDSSHIISIENGFAMQDGSSGENYPLSIPIEDLPMSLHAFYQYREDDNLGDSLVASNPSHSYSSFNYVSAHTFTNTYTLFESDSITLVKSLDHVRGFLDEVEKPVEPGPDPEPEPEPEPEPDPDHPAGEEDEWPVDWENTVYLRTHDHMRFKTEETGDDRVPNRYLTVDKTPEQLGKGSSESRAITASEEDDNPNSPENKDGSSIGTKVTPYGDNFVFHLRNCPLVSANWIKAASNESLLITKLTDYYKEIETITWNLENAFALDMKFYNTYGKSRFYKIGNNTQMTTLDSVNIVISFGAGLNFPASSEVFRDNFRSFIKEQIEATDDMIGNGINIYIMNLVAAAKTNFDEIAWLEYYGINNYGYDAQKLTIMSDEEILATVRADSFVPEFLNIIMEEVPDGVKPKVNIAILNS